MSQPQAIKRAYDRESNILIVDDDSTLLKFFKIHLNKFFSRVVVVESAKAALDTMKDRSMDLILTDVRMPKVDGLELMKKIRKQHPDIPVLLISGEPMTESQEKIVATSDGFLAKPFSIDELNDYINAGIDLRTAFGGLKQFLKDPKKIREVLSADASELEKYVKKSDLKEAEKIFSTIQKMKFKAA